MYQALQPVLIDTDIGDDVDDAFALALAAVHPSLRLCGVTTVCGPVHKRARLATLVLDAARQQAIPVAPGSSSMSNGKPGSARFSHQPLLEREQDRATRWIDKRHAIDFILECSHREPWLTLLTLGPMTNIAAALERDPTLAQRAQLVAMAGGLGIPYPDWNVRCDPEAARVVLASGMPTMLVGMNLTMRCKMRSSQLRHLFALSHPLARMLTRSVIAWRTPKRRMPILHDALAVAAVAEPHIVTFEPRAVHILPWGFSTARRDERPNALVGTTVDLQRFRAMIDHHLLNVKMPLDGPRSLRERIIGLVV